MASNSIAQDCSLSELQAADQYRLLYALPEQDLAIFKTPNNKAVRLTISDQLHSQLIIEEVLYQQVVVHCRQQRQRKVILYQNHRPATVITEQALKP